MIRQYTRFTEQIANIKLSFESLQSMNEIEHCRPVKKGSSLLWNIIRILSAPNIKIDFKGSEKIINLSAKVIMSRKGSYVNYNST